MRLYIKQAVFSWRDRFAVRDEFGGDRYFAEGEFFSMGKQLHVYDSNGTAGAAKGGRGICSGYYRRYHDHARPACRAVGTDD